MDFTLDDEQQAIHDITKQVLGDLSTHSRLKDLAVADDHVDCDAWAALAEAGVVGASIPEAHGGAGLGFLATAMALEVAGYHASPIPLLPTLVMGAMPIAEFGTPEQQAARLPPIADGNRVVDFIASDAPDAIEGFIGVDAFLRPLALGAEVDLRAIVLPQHDTGLGDRVVETDDTLHD